MRIAGAHVLVTGASSGIGAATARALAAGGATVGLVARRRERLAQVLEDCRATSPGSRMWVADLSDLDTVAALGRAVEEAFDGLDVLVNNAGAPMRRHVTALSPSDVEEVMRLNYFSPVRLAIALLPGMLSRRRGMLVNVASLGGRVGIATEAAYCASKFALAGWSEAAAIDLAGSGVQVRLVTPGAFDSEIWDQPGNDAPFYDGPKAPAAECAQAVLQAIEGECFETYAPDLQQFVVGKTADVDGFLAAMVGQLAPVAGQDETMGDSRV